MRFFTTESSTHFLYRKSYNVHFLSEPSMKEELAMIYWLDDICESHEDSAYTWYAHDTICFKKEYDRTLFLIKFS